MALDDATARFLAAMAQRGVRPIHEMTPQECRGLGSLLRQMYGAGPDVGPVIRATAPGPNGNIPVRVLTPQRGPRAIIVYFHGGGWVTGTLDEFDTLARKMVAATDAVVVLVDYRLAPEHRYPAAAEDAWAALLWVDTQIQPVVGSRVPLIVAGDSAGGNLAAIVSQRAQRERRPSIDLQILIYPVMDADFDTVSYLDPVNQLMVDRDAMRWFWAHYVPNTTDRPNPAASPLRAADLTGQPPAIVLTAECDVLRDEGEAYVAKLRAAGVPVTHHRFSGQMHGFFTLVNLLPGADAGLLYITEQIQKHLADSSAIHT